MPSPTPTLEYQPTRARSASRSFAPATTILNPTRSSRRTVSSFRVCRDFSPWQKASMYLDVVGRIRSYRLAGSKLIFFDLVQDGVKVQAMCNKRLLADVSQEKFKEFYRLLRRGDAFCWFPPSLPDFGGRHGAKLEQQSQGIRIGRDEASLHCE